jgi:hypothetical protein
LSKEWFSFTRKITCLIGESGETVAGGVALVVLGPVVGGLVLAAAPLVPLLAGQNCQITTIHATTNAAAASLRHVR